MASPIRMPKPSCSATKVTPRAMTLMTPRRPRVFMASGRRVCSAPDDAAFTVAREMSRKFTIAIDSPRHTPRPASG